MLSQYTNHRIFECPIEYQSSDAIGPVRFLGVHCQNRMKHNYLAVICGIVMLNMLALPVEGGDARRQGASGDSKDLTVRSIRTPTGWTPLNWTMSRDLFVVSESANDPESPPKIKFYAIEGEEFVARKEAAQLGDRPIFLANDDLMMVAEDKLLIQSGINTEIIGRVNLSNVGLLGEGTLIGKHFFFHTIDEYRDDPMVRMFAADLSTFQLIELGEGYYPILVGDARVFYVTKGPEYRLCQTTLPGAESHVNDRKNLTNAPVAWLKPGIRKNEILCQYGGYPWRIARVSFDGELIREISKDDVNAFAPTSSPSKKYVAYATTPVNQDAPTKVVVVNPDGNVLYSNTIAIPALSAFGWDIDADSLGVIVEGDAADERILKIVDFGRVK